MPKRKLNTKDYAQLLFSKNKGLLESLRVTKDASPLAIVCATSLAVFRLFPLMNKIALKKKNTKFFEEILKEYEQLLRRWYLGENTAYIKTAVSLTMKEEQELNEGLAEIFGRYFRLDIKVEPELIGGLVIKVGDKTIDRSILGKLNKLEQHIKT